MNNKQKLLLSMTIALSLGLIGCDDGDNGMDGSDGSNGSDGLTSLITQTQIAVGNVNCLNGGIQVDSGPDSNEDGLLGVDEITTTEYLCNQSITSLEPEQIRMNTSNAWYTAAESTLDTAEKNLSEVVAQAGAAKNVILFVGDGMGISTVTAARILAGQKVGLAGEEYQLSFDKMPFSGFSKTYNTNAQTPDSAGTMTAMMTGVKTNMGVIGAAANTERGDCASMNGNTLVSALHLAEIAGKSTGVVSTARLTHATPAAAYAQSPERNWEDISDMPAEEAALGCEDIASQLVNLEDNLETRFSNIDVDGLEVAMGGGRRHFLPKDATYNSADAQSEIEGDRTDGVDLTAVWQAKYPTGDYIIDQAGFDAINPETSTHLLGLFNESHMQYEADRANDIAGEPSLSEMTEKAIALLDNNEKGFFLTVEAGRIDHAHHAGNAYNALNDTIEFANAVEIAVNNTNPKDTLIIVTADHSHVFTIAGYPKRGNPILGKVVGVDETDNALASDGMPYTTLGYTNGRGFKDLGDETDADAGYLEGIVTGRVDLADVDTTSPGFHQESVIPTSSETHAGEDVGVYASGPSAHLVRSTNEQNYLFHVMAHAANLVDSANAAIE